LEGNLVDGGWAPKRERQQGNKGSYRGAP
jgi:hypothetical protein